MDPVSGGAGKITERFAEQSFQQGVGGKSPGAPSAADQAQFEQALNQSGQQNGIQGGSEGGVNNVQQVDQTSQMGNVNGAQQAQPTFGDAILNGIEKLKSGHDVRLERIEQTITESGGDMSVEQMMKLQFEVMQMGIEQDLTSKMADKSSQGVQTLFRNQG